MKFKSIFIIFNIVIIVSFLFFFIMPVLILGASQFFLFFSKYWIALLLFVILLAAFNAYFITNWKFFTYLEKEDWHGLIGFLEEKIYKKERFGRRMIKILINTYLCTSNIEGIKKLALFFKKRKPNLLSEFSLQFSVPYLISENIGESGLFFSKLLENKDLKHKDWITWNYGIILMQQKKKPEAASAFTSLLFPGTDPVICLLSLYMLSSISMDNPRFRETLDKTMDEFREKNTVKQLNDRLEQERNNIQIISLKNTIEDAVKWMYGDTAGKKEEAEKTTE